MLCNNDRSYKHRVSNTFSNNKVGSSDNIHSLGLNGKGFKIFNLNIQHLLPQLDQLKLLFEDNRNIDIYVFCETFLTSNT